MATTSPFGLRYPVLGDAPDGPQQFQNLAQDVNGWLGRARPVTSSTRPSSPTDGTLIVETDTGACLVAIGGTWYYLTSTTGGSGTGEATYSASTAQSIPNATDTVVAFGTDNATSSAVTKLAHGTGHKFRLNQGGVWSMVATIRYATTTATGERSAEFRTTSGVVLPGDGDAPTTGNPATLCFMVQQRFEANTEIYVNAWQGTGGSRLLEPFEGGARVRVNFVWLRS